MTISAGGSSGIVFPDSTTLPASEVTGYLAPGLTDTANVLTANPTAKPVQFNGTTGVTVNGATLSSASGFYPVNTVAPVITGATRDTQVLTVSNGTWSNNPTSYSYQWIRGTSTNIGTNTNTYTCVTADIGSTIKCTVTATNGVGSNSATSASVGPITANTYTITYLSVAGGGGGADAGNPPSGGGGGGGVLAGTQTATPGTLYVFGIGAGGGNGGQGSSTTAFGLTSIGGGGGGGTVANGGNGGSGGGGGARASGGSGTAGQGFNGGSGGFDGGNGGGGGGAAGAAQIGYTGGAGGTGYYSTITGSGFYVAGGGGGGSTYGGAGPGGAGGGGNGAYNYGDGGNSVSGNPGTVNTGGGGGGSERAAGTNGGSGVLYISMPTASYSGITTGSPTITTSGANTIIKFTSSGTYTA